MGRRLALELSPIKHRNGARDIGPVIAALAADSLQQQKRKHMSFKETARAGAVGFLSPTFPAVEFLEKPAPRGSGKSAHKYLLDRSILTPLTMKSYEKRRDRRT